MSRDIRAEFDRVIETMEWEEVLATLQDVINEELGIKPESLPTSGTPLAPSTQLDNDIHPGRVGDGPEAQGHQGIAPHSFENMQTGHQSCHEGFCIQGEHNLYQSVYEQPGPSTAACYAAAPPHTCNNTVVITVIENNAQKLVPIQLVNGEVVYAYALHPISAAPPPPPTYVSPKRKRRVNKPHEKDKPYTKRPLSAFMLFLKEQRQNVVAEIKIRDNATVNCVVGHRWALLSQQEKAKYYEQAEKEKLRYAMQNPGWTSSNTLGKKKARQGGKTLTAADKSGSKPEQQKKQTAAKEPMTSNSGSEKDNKLVIDT